MKQDFIMIGDKKYKLVEVKKEKEKSKKIDPKCKVYVAYQTGSNIIFSITDKVNCGLKEGRYVNVKDVLIVKHIGEVEAKIVESKAMPYEGFFSGMVEFFMNGGKQDLSKAHKTKLQKGDKSKRPTYDSAVLLVRPDYVEAVNLLKQGFSMRSVSKALNICYTSVYKLNVSFCGYEPREYQPKKNFRYKGKVYKKDGVVVKQSVSVTKIRKPFGYEQTECIEKIDLSKNCSTHKRGVGNTKEEYYAEYQNTIEMLILKKKSTIFSRKNSYADIAIKTGVSVTTVKNLKKIFNL